MKISNKLNLLIGVSSVIILTIGLVSYLYLKKATGATADLYHCRIMPVLWLDSIQENIKTENAELLKLISATDVSKKREAAANIMKKETESEELLKKYEATKPDSFELENIEDYKEEMEEYKKVRDTVINLAMENKNAQSYKYYLAQKDNIDEAQDAAGDLSEYNVKAAEKMHNQMEKNETTADTILAVTMLGGLGLLAFLISRIIKTYKSCDGKIVHIFRDNKGNVATGKSREEALRNLSQRGQNSKYQMTN